MAATKTSRSARSRPRPSGRPRGKNAPSRLKRGLLIAGVLGAGVLVGVLISLPDRIDRAILEVTLPLRHDDIIRQESRQHGVDASLIAGVIYVESKFRDQTSSAGARGLMQITPDTADTIANLSGGTDFVLEDLSNPDHNIGYGTFYLRHLLDRFGGNEVAALAGYNAGPENVVAWGGSDLQIDDIEFAETRAYVSDVLEKRVEYRRKYPTELGY